MYVFSCYTEELGKSMKLSSHIVVVHFKKCDNSNSLHHHIAYCFILWAQTNPSHNKKKQMAGITLYYFFSKHSGKVRLTGWYSEAHVYLSGSE